MLKIIFTLLLLSTISQAAEVEVNWSCPQNNYADIPQLEQQLKVKVIFNESGVKFKPDPFRLKLFGPSLFKSINPLNKAKKSLAVDYTSCIDQFVTEVKNKLPEHKDEWARKIKNDIENKPFIIKSDGKKLLPTQWDLNKRYGFKDDQWAEKLNDICEGKTKDYLGAELLTYVNRYASMTLRHPSKKCIETIAKSIEEKIAKDQAEFCEYSKNICNELKALKLSATAQVNIAKERRKKAMLEAEAKFEKHIPQKGENVFEKGFQDLFSKDGGDCQQYLTSIPSSEGEASGQTIKMHNLISKNMDKLMDHLDGTCQQRFIRQYMDQNSTQSLIGDWGIVSYCKINETEFCSSLKDRFKIVDQNIARMLEKAYGKDGKDFYSKVACEIEAGPKSLDELLGQLIQFEKALTCRQLAVGDSHVVDSSNLGTRSPTGISMRYSMERTGDKSLKARLNLNFKPKPGTNVSEKEMFDRAQACMNDLSPYFKGPEGEVMAIDIINSDDAKKLKSSQRPPRIDISISGPGHRSNSGDYESDIDCPTIAHEVMHLMGLCDEYSEQWIGNSYDPVTGKIVANNASGAKFVNSYNCRVVAKVPSIMSNQNTVINAVVPKAPTCKCVTADCHLFTKASKKVQDLYIKDPWGISIGKLNSEYCSYKDQTPLSLTQYEAVGKLLTLNEETESGVGYSIRYWDDAHPKQVQNLKINCNCPAGNDSCLEYLTEIKNDIKSESIPQKLHCPSGSKTVSNKTGNVDDSKGVVLNEDGSFSFNGGFFDDEASLLHPQHFERIANGACPDKAKPYSSCSQFAYQTDPSGKCSEVPKECLDPKYFLGTGSKQ